VDCAIRKQFGIGGLAMKTKLLAAATGALTLLFSINAASAETYTINIDYNLLDGTIFCGSTQSNGTCGSSVFSSQYSFPLPVSLPTLHAGDVIDTTINFTRGLALTINDPFPGDRQGFDVFFFSNNSANAYVLTQSQLSLIHAHGDLVDPLPSMGGLSNCGGGCLAGDVTGTFTDGSFSFRGMEIVTTILSIPQPFGSDTMNFSVILLGPPLGPLGPGDIEITHGASDNVVPLPPALPLFATGLGALGLLGWRRKRKGKAIAI
jgi:hypothetical protein